MTRTELADSRHFRLESTYQNLIRIICVIAVVSGALVLAGWFFGVDALLRARPGHNPMRFNTALCLIASGGGLWLVATATSGWRTLVTRWLGVFVFTVALLTLAEHIFGWDLHLDQLFYKDVWSPSQPGRMVLLVALFFVFAGTFLILSGTQRKALAWTSQFAAILANLTAQGAVLEVILRANKGEGPALHSAMAIFALSIGMLLVPNRWGVLSMLQSMTAGGRIIRRFLPTATIGPLVAGWIYLEVTQTGLLPWRAGIAIMVALCGATLFAITVWTAKSIDRIDLRLGAIVDSSDDAIFSKSLDGVILTWNQGAEQFYGYTAAEAIGQSMLMVVPPELHTEIQNLLERIRHGESVKHYETARMRKDGARVEVSVTLSPVRIARGEVIGCWEIGRDITERNRNEQRLEIALNSAQLGTWELDLVNDIAIRDLRHDQIFGYQAPQAEWGSEIFQRHVLPEDLDGVRSRIQEAIDCGKLFIECRIVWPDGSIRWVSIHGIVLLDGKGKPGKMIGTVADVTERKQAETVNQQLNQELEARVEVRTAQLRESEHQVRKKLDSILSPEGDLEDVDLADILDVPVVQSLGEGLFKLAGIPIAIMDIEGNVLIGAGWQDICTKFHREHPEACKNCMESDRELSAGVQSGEFKLYKCKNNMWDVATPIMLGSRHIGNLFSGQFLFDDETVDTEAFQAQARKYGFDEREYLAAINRIPRLSREAVQAGMEVYAKLAEVLSEQGYAGIKLARSMTESARANTQLLKSAQELESFAYSVSHDLRAPLRHLDGYLSLLFKRSYSALDEQAKHYIDCTLEASQRMGRLIDELLQFSRLGRSEIHKAPVNLNELIEEVRIELEPETRDRLIDWRVDPLPAIEADLGMLRQVIANLLGNAVKFTLQTAGAKITIGSKPDTSGNIMIFVEDNGAGFDMRYYNKLFQVFQRLHGEDEFEGTGIGLATVRRIVERHGGRVWAEGAVGAGATFYFSLPYDCGKSGEPNELVESHLVG